jgi:hypothetical protein
VVLFRLQVRAKMLEGSALHSAFTQGFRYSIARSLQPEDGDPFIGGVQCGVASQLRHGFQQGQHRRVENRECLTRDKIFDDTLLFPQRERFA